MNYNFQRDLDIFLTNLLDFLKFSYDFPRLSLTWKDLFKLKVFNDRLQTYYFVPRKMQ